MNRPAPAGVRSAFHEQHLTRKSALHYSFCAHDRAVGFEWTFDRARQRDAVYGVFGQPFGARPEIGCDQSVAHEVRVELATTISAHHAERCAGLLCSCDTREHTQYRTYVMIDALTQGLSHTRQQRCQRGSAYEQHTIKARR